MSRNLLYILNCQKPGKFLCVRYTLMYQHFGTSFMVHSHDSEIVSVEAFLR